MQRILFLVGLGGALGSILRYCLGTYLTKTVDVAFPMGTFFVNVLGCLAIGALFGLSDRWDWFTPEWRLFLATGFCGGFTTFSAFALENISFLQSGDYKTFVLYTLASLIFGFLSVLLGMQVGKI